MHADTRRYTRVPACSCGSCSRARGAGAGAGRPAAGATTVHSRSVRGNKVPGYVSMRPFITLAAFQACRLRSGGQGGREWLPPPAHAASPAAVNPCSRLAFLAGARRNTQKHGNTRVRVFLCPIHVACSRVPVLTRAPCRSLCSCVLLRAPACSCVAAICPLRGPTCKLSFRMDLGESSHPWAPPGNNATANWCPQPQASSPDTRLSQAAEQTRTSRQGSYVTWNPSDRM